MAKKSGSAPDSYSPGVGGSPGGMFEQQPASAQAPQQSVFGGFAVPSSDAGRSSSKSAQTLPAQGYTINEPTFGYERRAGPRSWGGPSGGMSDFSRVRGPFRRPYAPAYDTNTGPDPSSDAEQGGWGGPRMGATPRTADQPSFAIQYGDMSDDQPPAQPTPTSPNVQPGPEVGILRKLAGMLRSYQ